MVIDSHGHVTAPPELYAYRSGLLASRGAHGQGNPNISEERMEMALDRHFKRLQHAGIDRQLISPRPFQQMHSEKPERIVHWWIRANNDLIARHVKAHPDVFVGVCGIPQHPGVSPKNCFEELERCVKELGFVGCLLNPDPSESHGDDVPPLGDEYWYPLYEKLVELDVPALIHSAGCCSPRQTYSVHFIVEETLGLLSLFDSRVFEDFPKLKLICSHGGGAIPYQMGRWMAGRYNRKASERFEESMRKVYYDTCLYTKDALELLCRAVGTDRVVFGTENPGTGSATHPDTGKEMDDLRPVIESIAWLTADDKRNIFEANTMRLHRINLG